MGRLFLIAITIGALSAHADKAASDTAAQFLSVLGETQQLHEIIETEARKVLEMDAAVKSADEEIRDLEAAKADLEQARDNIANNVPQVPQQPQSGAGSGSGSGGGGGGGGGDSGGMKPMEPPKLSEAPQFELPEPMGETPVMALPGSEPYEGRGMMLGDMPKNNFQLPQLSLPQGAAPAFDPRSIAQNGLPTLTGASTTGGPISQDPNAFLNQGGGMPAGGGGGGMPGMAGGMGGAGGGGAGGDDVMASVGNEPYSDTASGITTTSLAVGEGSGGGGESASGGSGEIIIDPDESPVKAQRGAMASLLKGTANVSNPEPQGLMVYGPGFLASSCSNKTLKKMVGVCLGPLPGGFTPAAARLAENDNAWPAAAPVVEAGVGGEAYRSRILELVSRGIASEK